MKKVIVLTLIILLAGGGFYLWKQGKLGKLTSIATTKDLFESELLAFVPDDVVGLTLCSSDINKLRGYWQSDSYKALAELLQDKARVERLITYFSKGSEEINAAEIAQKVQAITRAALESETLKSQFEISDYVQFQLAGAEGEAYPPSGMLMLLKKEINYAKDFAALKEAGMPISSEQLDGTEVFSLDYIEILKHYIPVPIPEGMQLPELKLYVASQGTRVVTASSKEIVARFLKNQPYDKKPALLSDPTFIAARQSRPFNASRDICYGYMDFRAMMASTLRTMTAMLENNGNPIAAPSSAEMADKFPITSVVQTIGYDKSLYFTQHWGINPNVVPEDVKPWMEAFRTSEPLHGLNWLPDSAALALAINGESVRKVKALAQTIPGQGDMIANVPQFALLDSLEGIGLAMLPQSVGSPWPEGVLVAKLDGAQSVIDLVKGQLSVALEQGMGGGLKWQSKEIAGKTTSYFQTPLGVGLFMMGNGPILATSSSEAALAATLPVVENGKGSIAGKLSELGLSDLGAPLIAGFLNIPTIGRIAKDAQASTAMFTGQSEMLPADFDIFFKVMGDLFISVQLSGDFVSVTMAHHPG